MINLPALADRLTALGLMDRPFFNMNRDEVEALCQAVLDCHQTRPMTMPYISERYQEPVLIIPDDAPPDLQPWKQQDGYAALHRVLCLIGADEAMMRRYLGVDWKTYLVETT